MKRLKNTHLLLVKHGGYDHEKGQREPFEVHLDGVLLEKFEG